MFRVGPNKIFHPKTKRVFLDTETTGLELPEATILSIAFIVEEFEGNKWHEIDRLDIAIMPTKHQWQVASPEALKVNGMTMEFLEEHAISYEEATKRLNGFIVKTGVGLDNSSYLIGQNPKFDIKFLRSYYPTLDWLGFPYHNVIDNIAYALILKDYDSTFRPRKLSGHYLSKALGVKEEDKVHTAIGGTEVVRRNYLEIERRLASIIDNLRNIVKDKGKLNKTYPQARLAPGDTLDDFRVWAVEQGYEPYPGEPFWFSDKDGFRWEWFEGDPNILVNLNTTP